MKTLNRKDNISLVTVILILAVLIFGTFYYFDNKKTVNLEEIQSKANMPYYINIVKETEKNTDFRRVLFTGTRSQLVIMNIPVGGEVGEETHTYTEQALFFLSGTGKSIMNAKEGVVGAGDVVVVTPGTKHNFINTGKTPLKIYVIYSPANHFEGRIHVTKADADKDTQDEAFGNVPK